MSVDAGTPPVEAPDIERDRRRFRRTLLKVMSVQVIALVLLWLLQQRYTP